MLAETVRAAIDSGRTSAGELCEAVDCTQGAIRALLAGEAVSERVRCEVERFLALEWRREVVS